MYTIFICFLLLYSLQKHKKENVPGEDGDENTGYKHKAKKLVFASPVQSGFLPPKWATVNRNWSRTDPDIVGTEPDHLGLVFCSLWN